MYQNLGKIVIPNTKSNQIFYLPKVKLVPSYVVDNALAALLSTAAAGTSYTVVRSEAGTRAWNTRDIA